MIAKLVRLHQAKNEHVRTTVLFGLPDGTWIPQVLDLWRDDGYEFKRSYGVMVREQDDPADAVMAAWRYFLDIDDRTSRLPLNGDIIEMDNELYILAPRGPVGVRNPLVPR